MAKLSPFSLCTGALLGAGVGALAMAFYNHSPTPQDPLDAQCLIAATQILAHPKPEPNRTFGNPEYVLHRERDQRRDVHLHARFASAIDGCIVILSDDLRNSHAVVDLHNSLLRDMAVLFTCRRDGMHAVNIAKARSFNGRVYQVAPNDFSDNLPPLDGGDYPPVSLSRGDCKRALHNYLRALGASI